MSLKRLINSFGPLAKMKNKILRVMTPNLRRLLYLYRRQGWQELVNDIRADSFSSKVNWTESSSHLIFVSGLPKSGTTWIEQLLGCTPGMVQLNRSVLRVFPHSAVNAEEANITPEMLSCAPANKLSYIKLHSTPEPAHFALLEEFNIKVVVLIRDLRDQAISSMQHGITVRSHPLYSSLVDCPEDKRLLASMSFRSPLTGLPLSEYYANWVIGWIEYANNNPEMAMIVKYENMVNDILYELKRIFDFCGYEYTNNTLDNILSLYSKRHYSDRMNSLKDNLSKVGRLTSTFREGIPGEWQQIYSKEELDYAKTYFCEALIASGYEMNSNW